MLAALGFGQDRRVETRRFEVGACRFMAWQANRKVSAGSTGHLASSPSVAVALCSLSKHPQVKPRKPHLPSRREKTPGNTGGCFQPVRLVVSTVDPEPMRGLARNMQILTYRLQSEP